MFFSFIYYICLCFACYASAGNFSEYDPEDLIQQCNLEIKNSSFNGACLTLGIVAKKIKHEELYQKIESLCVEHFQSHRSSGDSPLQALIKYFPQCMYVFKGDASSIQSSKTFQSDVELKTLVRFLNNTNLE